MKITELVELLEKAHDNLGDVEVCIQTYGNNEEAKDLNILLDSTSEKKILII